MDQTNNNAMPNMKLQLKLIQPSVLRSESLNVEVTLTNETPVAQTAPSRRAASEFEYVIRPAGETGNVRIVSARRARQAFSSGRAPDPRPESESIAPGESLVYKEDLAAYASEGLAAGRYLLSVVHGSGAKQIESPAVRLTIMLPNVAGLALASSPDGKLGVFFAHRDADKSFTLFQQECPPRKPLQAPAQRRVNVQPPSRITGVAGAFKLDTRTWERWYAWLRDDASLGGGLAWGKASYATIKPQPLGLQTARLFPTGWQLSPEAGIFAALGLDGQSRLQLALVTLQKQDTAQVVPVALAGATIPEFWVVSAKAGEGDSLDFVVITADAVGGRIKLNRQRVTMEPPVAEPPTTLVERSEPLVALAMYPIVQDKPGVVDCLFGPEGGPPAMTFVRLPLDGGRPLLEYPFSVPTDVKRRPPTEWALSPTPLSEPVVLAKFGDQLLARRLSAGNQFFVLADGASQATHLRLEVVSDEVWAIWADPTTGIQYKKVP